MRRIIAVVGGIIALALVTAVAAMTVQPVVLDLKMAGREMSAPLRVENNGPNPLPVEIRIVETDFTPDGVSASDRVTEDVMAFPPQAIIPPGATQVFRVQYLGDPDADRSRHYYAEVSQLPVQLPEGQSAIQILYNFQVMVNVASNRGGEPSLSIQDAAITQNAAGENVVAFTVHNSARNYGYLSAGRLTVVHTNASGQEVMRRTLNSNDIQQLIGFGLVGPETTRRFVSPITLDSADGRVEVQFARGR
jgi:fimbrial chaperone protein